ncbi:MAG: hypothetical protein M0P31_09500 [Solirubrobacteraceae bacterium]|nr:hypothetical protein [Solirubrobacteraceae bacterium]
MRPSRPPGVHHALALVGCLAALGVAGCGDDDDPATVPASTAPTLTDAPATTVAPTDTEPDDDGPATTETTTTSTEPSGGTPAPGDAPTATRTSPGDAGGAQPRITVDGDVARATAGDAALAELWCDQARAGAYDAELGDAGRLVITVRGGAERTCELPR